ncbi:MAG TPA: enoyl-CoA hydratase/isomerase family protein [Acidimicrobiales bacterium]|nr:enoyl-CoA hydratase/isomerase family protein [Acidimicrobiales bacterium]
MSAVGSGIVHLERAGAVAGITLGDGTRHNAMRQHDWCELARTFEVLADDDTLRCVTVRGGGPTFSAGSDIAEWDGASVEFADESFRQMERAFQAVEALPVPVVAALRGVATGAGLQLALACDLRVAATDARIGMPIARLGVLVTRAFADRVSCLAGAGLARDLFYTGRLLSGADAFAHGLVERCVDPAEVDATTEAIVAQIVALPPSSVRAAKAATSCRPGPPEPHSVDPGAFQAGVGSFLAARAARGGRRTGASAS